ncbi:hypothetical protein TSAR_014442 [Trichomalopsis sarcophagae]|uniref:Sas10 C-terminal domain-containing protein n=1 Tax=Trichomalopsis sarcophagae TaxID=543379 RepID=A0A232EQI2_9HYME|nr:hypothetical protein TSAR_014442 [Trichomalopsis sarcophagae]
MLKRKRNQEDDSSGGEMDDINMDEMLDSEEEFSENERNLLEKVRQKRKPENYDSEDEVMGFKNEEYDEDEDEEEKDSMESDIEGLGDDYDLPNEKAWGKKKKDFYSTDYVDADYASTSQKEIADAELEEQEARNLQKRLVEQLDEADFGLELIVSKEDASECNQDGEHIKTDLSKLSKRQKQELFEKESPEFLPLITDFQDRLTEARTVLGPYLDLVERANCKDCAATNFVKAKYDLLLHYCTNISFYLMLKAKKEPVASHPVIKRLAQYRQLLAQLEECQGDILDEIKELLEANENGETLYNSGDFSEVNIEKKKVETVKHSANKHKKLEHIEKADKNRVVYEGDSSMDEDEKYDQEISGDSDEGNKEENEDQEDTEEKRAITYQIAKNRGLTPHRKKEQRNPRVKHRNKYRKAKIRRRGAVREVRKETTRYGGEISGIKATVKKSIKLK